MTLEVTIGELDSLRVCPTLKPDKSRLIYPLPPIQDNLPGFQSKKTRQPPGLRPKLGLFYEILASNLFGGELYQSMNYISPTANNSPEDAYTLHAKPDVIHIGRFGNRILECKAIRRWGDVQLIDSQIEKYSQIILDPLDLKDYSVDFVIFRHNIQSLQKSLKNSSPDKMVSRFAESPLYALVIPFSLILAIHNTGKTPLLNHAHTYRWEGGKGNSEKYPFKPMTRVRPNTLNDLFFNPEATISAMGISEEFYSHELYSSPVLSVRGYNSHRIPSFPIRIIKDLDYPSWLQRFRETHHSQRGQAEESLFNSVLNDSDCPFNQQLELIRYEEWLRGNFGPDGKPKF